MSEKNVSTESLIEALWIFSMTKNGYAVMDKKEMKFFNYPDEAKEYLFSLDQEAQDNHHKQVGIIDDAILQIADKLAKRFNVCTGMSSKCPKG